MLTTLLFLCAMVWLAVLFCQITHRGYLVLLIWLLIAPIVTNLVNGEANPFFSTPQIDTAWGIRSPVTQHKKYATGVTRLTLNEILEPTRTLIGLFLVVFLLSTICKKQPLVPLDKVETWMIVFSLILLASAFFQSKRSEWAMRHALDGFIIPFLGYYIARRLIINEERFRQLIQVLGYLSFYVIILCLIERSVHKELLYRLHGPFVSQAKLQVALVVAFYGLLIEQRTLPSGMRGFALYLTPIIILLTWLRANWVGFLSGAWVFLFLGYRLSTHRQKLHKLGLGLMLIPIIVIGAGTLLSQEVVTQDIIKQRVAAEGTVNWRLERWSIAIQEGIKHPFFGVGLTNLQDVLGRAGLNYATAHSSFLTFFAEHGVPGLLVYLVLVTSIIQMGLRLYHKGATLQDRWRGVAIIVVLITHQMPSFFYNELHSFTLGHIYVYVFVGGIVGLYSRPHSVCSQHVFSKRHQLMAATK